MTVQTNLGGTGRVVYVIFGAAFASWGLWGAEASIWKIVLLTAGGALIVFGFIGFCPARWALRRTGESR